MALDDNTYVLSDTLQTMADVGTMRLREWAPWAAELLQRTEDKTAQLVANDGAIRFKVSKRRDATEDNVPTRFAGTLPAIVRTPWDERDDVFAPYKRIYNGTEWAWTRAAAGAGPEMAEKVIGMAEAVGDRLNDSIFGWLDRITSSFWPEHGTAPIDIGTVTHGDVFRLAGIKRRFRYPRGVLPEVWIDAEFAEALNNLDGFRDSSVRGDGRSLLLQMAEFPTTYGATFQWDDRILTHTAGTASTDALILSAPSQTDTGLMEISGATAGATLLAGDLFSFAGDDVGRVIAHPDRYQLGETHIYTADGGGAITGVRYHPAADATVLTSTGLNQIGDHRYCLFHIPEAYISAQYRYRSEARTYQIATARDLGTPTQPGTGIMGNLVVGSNGGQHADFMDFAWTGGLSIREPNWSVRVRVTV